MQLKRNTFLYRLLSPFSPMSSRQFLARLWFSNVQGEKVIVNCYQLPQIFANHLLLLWWQWRALSLTLFPPINTLQRSRWMRLFRGPCHMVNIIVMVFSPLGDYMCLRNRDTLTLKEPVLEKRQEEKGIYFSFQSFAVDMQYWFSHKSPRFVIRFICWGGGPWSSFCKASLKV